MVKKQRSFASRSSSSSRPGLERAVSQADQMGSAGGPDDDIASVLSRSSSGGERVRGSTQVSKHHSHGTPGPKSPKESGDPMFHPRQTPNQGSGR